MASSASSVKMAAFFAAALAFSFNCEVLGATGESSPASSYSEAFGKSRAYLTFRYRYEYVDEGSFSEKAKASTLQTRFGFESGEYRDWKLGLEFNNVTIVGNEQYNSTRNGLTQYPTVADPEGTIVNHAFIDYSPGKSNFILGR